jgi:hypothetical protein
MPKGVKFRGKSVYQVLERLEDARKAQNALWIMQQAVSEQVARLTREADEKLIALGFEELDGLTPADLVHGFHACTSPTDRCIYHIKDQWTNRCLFCGEPSDRG